jgi:hypothetical protein
MSSPNFATLVAGNDVIGFHLHAAESMADAAAPMALRKQLRDFVSGKAIADAQLDSRSAHYFTARLQNVKGLLITVTVNDIHDVIIDAWSSACIWRQRFRAT